MTSSTAGSSTGAGSSATVSTTGAGSSTTGSTTGAGVGSAAETSAFFSSWTGAVAAGVVAGAVVAGADVAVVVVVVFVSAFLLQTVKERRIATERRATIANFPILFLFICRHPCSIRHGNS